jgi:hypothetical protein
MKVINLFAGPGAGKSTARAGLFNLMKNNGINCEEVTEYAKDVTWDETQVLLSDQLYVLANQNRRLTRLKDKVEYAVSDSPLLLTINYLDPQYLPYTFRGMTMELWNTYDNINYFIQRTKPYNPVGRNQTADEAKQIDANIKMMLDYLKIPYKEIPGDKTAPYKIFNDLFPEKYINTESTLALLQNEVQDLYSWLSNNQDDLVVQMNINGICNGLIFTNTATGQTIDLTPPVDKW